MTTILKESILYCSLCCFSLAAAQNIDSLLSKVEQQYESKTLTTTHLDSLSVAYPDLTINPKFLIMKFNLFFNKDNYPMAIKTLLEAKQYTKEFQIQYDILNNLGVCFNATANYEQSLVAFSEAQNLAVTHNRQDEVDYAYENVLYTRLSMGDKTAESDFEQMIATRDYFGDDCYKLQSITLLSHHYISNNQFSKNKSLYGLFASNLATIDSCFFIKGSIYEDHATIALHEENPKMALMYLDSVSLQNYPSDLDKIPVYENYKKAYNQLNDHEQESRYQDTIIKIQEKNMAHFNTTNSLAIAEITQQQWLSKKRIKWLGIVLGIGVCIGLALLFLLGRSSKIRKQLNHLLGINNKKFHDLWVDFQLSVKQMEQIKNVLKNRRKENNTLEVSEILKKIQLYLQANRDNPYQFIDATKDAFITELELKAPFLNVKELLLCFFFSLGFSHKKIAELLNRTERSVDSSKYRINQKLKHHLDTDIETISKNIGGK